MKRYLLLTELKQTYRLNEQITKSIPSYCFCKLDGKGRDMVDVYAFFEYLLQGDNGLQLKQKIKDRIGVYASELPQGWRKQYYLDLLAYEVPGLPDADLERLVNDAMANIKHAIPIAKPKRDKVSKDLLVCIIQLDAISSKLNELLANPNVSDLTMELSEALSDAKARADV